MNEWTMHACLSPDGLIASRTLPSYVFVHRAHLHVLEGLLSFSLLV